VQFGWREFQNRIAMRSRHRHDEISFGCNLQRELPCGEIGGVTAEVV
jgi:hypothetical protein